MASCIDPTRESVAAFRGMRRAGPVGMLTHLRFRARAAHDDGTACSGDEA